MSDEIMNELRQIKDSIAREHGYDIKRIVAHLRERERPAGQRIVDLSVRRVKDDQGVPPDSSGHDELSAGEDRGLGRQCAPGRGHSEKASDVGTDGGGA